VDRASRSLGNSPSLSEALLFALAPDAELRFGAGRHAADLSGEIAGIFDRVPVDRGNHVAGLNAGLGSGAAHLRFGD
jgi:hypothetical protein